MRFTFNSRWLLIPMLASMGCGSETALMFEVTRDSSDVATENIDELELHVGFNLQSNPNVVVDNPDAEQPSVDVSARELASDPYSLLVKPGDLGGKTYADAGVQIVVLGLRAGEVVAGAWLSEPVFFADSEVRRYELVLHGDVFVDEGEGGCTSIIDGPTVATPSDQDCDGDINPGAGGNDCDDLDATVGPRQPEKCENQKDDNCNGKVDFDDTEDLDGDGYIACSSDPGQRDCFESGEETLIAKAAAVNPGAKEICDGQDNNCDGLCDHLAGSAAGGLDDDEDGVTTCGSIIAADGYCAAGPSDERVDCRDDLAAVNFRKSEVCDGVDNDCDGKCDDDEAFDGDGDQYTTCSSRAIDDGAVAGVSCGGVQSDCDDSLAHIYPGATEVCDGYDSDCTPNTAAETAECYRPEGEDCFQGRSNCSDADPVNPIAVGCVGDVAAPSQYCEAYAACLQADVASIEVCTAATVETQDINCTIAVFKEGEQLQVCHGAGTFALPADPGNACSWTLRPISGLGANIADEGLCATSLTIDSVPAAGSYRQEIWRLDPDLVLRLAVTTKLTEAQECPVAEQVLNCDDGGN